MDAHDAPVAVQSRRFLARNHIARIFLFELCSTAFLSFMAFSTVYLPPLDVYPRQLNPFHGIVLAIIIYAIVCFSGSFSGANLNPAITVCYFLHKQREKGDLKLFCSYILAQFIGGLLGIVLSRYIYDCGAAVFVSQPDLPILLRDILGEFLATFMFVLMVFVVISQQTTFIYSEAWTHLFIPVIFYVSRSFSQYIGSINPAIIIMMQVQAVFSQNLPIGTLWPVLLLSLSETLAALVAHWFYRVYRDTVVKWKKTM